MKTSLIFAAGLTAAIAAGLTDPAELRADSPQETVTPLLTVPLAGDESKEVRIFHISAPPGFETPKHFHPGQLFLYVVEGAITIDLEGEEPVKLGPGDVIAEHSGTNMVGRNPSSTHGAELIVFEIGNKGEPLQVKAQ